MLEDATVLTGLLAGDAPAEVAGINVRVQKGTWDPESISA